MDLEIKWEILLFGQEYCRNNYFRDDDPTYHINTCMGGDPQFEGYKVPVMLDYTGNDTNGTWQFCVVPPRNETGSAETWIMTA